MKRCMGRIMDKRKYRGLCAEKRVRTQFLFADYDTLTDVQAVELMLSFVSPCEDCGKIAGKLIGKFGSLAGVLDARREELKTVGGINNLVTDFIKFCSSLPDLYEECDSRRRIIFGEIRDAVDFICDTMDFDKEGYYYFCLNAKNELLYYNSMGDFPLGKMFTTNREMFKQILKFPTSNVLICHIIPKGDPKPTTWEIRFTRELRDLLATVYIGLTDHIVMTKDSYFSFYKIGLLKPDCPKSLDKKFIDVKMELFGDDLRCQSYSEKKNKKKKKVL